MAKSHQQWYIPTTGIVVNATNSMIPTRDSLHYDGGNFHSNIMFTVTICKSPKTQTPLPHPRVIDLET